MWFELIGFVGSQFRSCVNEVDEALEFEDSGHKTDKILITTEASHYLYTSVQCLVEFERELEVAVDM